ncbi:MAG: T9SS type A sorting domain-containing protein [Ignavibacteriae bacterium]|nr:T9SS type A sorting domain-containing protein [Ignavibacteriota bacterium]
MKYKFSLLILLIINIFQAFSEDTIFVKPSELEPNWGLWASWDPLWESFYSPLNSEIVSFRISQDGRYLAYVGYTFTDNDSLNFHFYDTHDNREIFKTIYSGVLDWPYSFWFLDSVNVIYIHTYPPDNTGHFEYKLLKLNLETLQTDSLTCGTGENNCMFGTIGADRKGYVTETEKKIYKRLNIDSSFKSSHPINESIPNFNEPFGPKFPPCNIAYSLSQLYTRDSGGFLIDLGFSIVHNFDYQNNRRDFYYSSIPVPDSSWLPLEGYIYAIGTYGEIYLRLGYISKEEKAKGRNWPIIGNKNPFDSVMLAARSTWGYYRIDTSGNNLVQLVRFWGPNHNLQVSCDGTIYYEMINMEDTTSSIWKMNKYGKDKQMVFNLKKPVTSVNENKFFSNEINGIYLAPNPASTSIDFIYKLQSLGIAQITLTNSYGQQVYSVIVYNINPEEEQRHSIDINSLPSGLYFVTLRSPAVVLTKGVVVVK